MMWYSDLSTIVTRGGNEGNTLRLSGLPMWDSPIFIMNKSALKLK